ncbi:hypothetical protein [Streptomyces sp. HNM0574]|uniref:hypothetical protein n=1 Tax=Streptomyces sp. HNM0574 TaxID=2714954 RepID=UPI00146A020B|nr:hypothetical protein [Streptomyces sp. HNM0574]
MTLVTAGAVTTALLSAAGCSVGGDAAGTDDGAPVSGSGGAGVGDGRNAPAPHDAVRGAADVLVKAGTSAASTSMLTESGGTRLAVDGRGAFDYARGVGRLEVRLPQGGPGSKPGERRPITELLAPGALYMKNRGAGVPADKWVRLDVTRLPDGNLLTNGATSPLSAAELLRGARKVTYEGERTLGARDVRGAAGDMGTAVHHYSGTVELSAAAEAASPRVRRQLAAAARGFASGTVPFDAYVDGQGRLRKVRHQFRFATGSATGSDGTAVSSTTWFHDFGVPVQVEMPDPEDIFSGTIGSSAP